MTENPVEKVEKELYEQVHRLRRAEYNAVNRAATKILVRKYETEHSLIYQKLQSEIVHRFGT